MRTGNRTRPTIAVVLALSLVALSGCRRSSNESSEVAGKESPPSAQATDVDASTAETSAGDATASGGAPDSAAPSARYEHQFDESYAGPVWITITSEADAADVLLTWGPYSVSFEHRGPSASYWFTKSAADAPGTGVPVAVMVAPAATVTFHEGDPPADAIDVNEGWTQQS